MRNLVEKIKSNDQIFSWERRSKDLVLDCEGGKKLDENGFTNFVNLKMSAISRSELLGKRLPMWRGKEFRIYNGGGSTNIKEGNYREGFSKFRKTKGNLCCGDWLVMKRWASNGKNAINSVSFRLLIIWAGGVIIAIRDLNSK